MTTRHRIETAAFALFRTKGFDGTTWDDIATSVGVGRRTLFRYFGSKNDIAWGEFDTQLAEFRSQLDAAPLDRPVCDVLHATIVAFNTVPSRIIPHHRFRMNLILHTPTLRADSTLRFDEWRQIVATFVAARLSTTEDDVVPRVVGHVSLALSIAAYEEWLTLPNSHIEDCLDRSMGALRAYLNDG